MKRIISFVLAFVMAFSFSAVAFASNNDAADIPKMEADYELNGYPVIIIRGIDFANLTYENGENAMNLNFDLKRIGGILSDYLSYKTKCDRKALLKTIMDTLHETFDPIGSAKDGTSAVPGVGMKKYYTSAKDFDMDEFGIWGEHGILRGAIDIFGAENVYFYTYDWRISPLKLADEVNEMIEKIKLETGKSKVNISASSMGCMVTAAYLYKYGAKSTENIAFLSGAHNGLKAVGCAFSGEVKVNGTVLGDYVDYLTRDTNVIIKTLLKIVRFSGIYNLVAKLANNIVEKEKEEIYSGLLRDDFGTSLGLWGMCPDEYFDSGVEYIFGSCKDEYPTVISELKNIREFVFSTEKILASAEKDGAKLSFLSNYNYPVVPVYEGCEETGDSGLETVTTSNGATCAPRGKILTDEQIASADKKYLSPDKMIDASTCLYKDSTWFVKDSVHVSCDYGSDYLGLALWLIGSKGQPTITSNAKYPQFIFADGKQNFIEFSE